MSLDLTAPNKYWTVRARLDGLPVRLTGLPSRSLGFDKARSTCRLPMADVPTQASGESAIIDAGWNGRTERFFTGEVESSGADDPSLQRTVQCIDVLRNLKYASTANFTWSGASFPDAVEEVLNAAGISRIGFIYDPGLTLGSEEDITIDTSEPLERVLADLMAYGGCKVWVTPAGLVRVDSITPVPAGSYVRLPNGNPAVYADTPTSDELGMLRASQQLGAPDQLISSATITGPTRADGVTPTGNATLSSVLGVPYNREYRFVQSSADAAIIAQRELDRGAANRRWLTIEVPFNPYILPGQTIGVRDSRIGISATTPALVWSVDSQGPRMTLRCVIGEHVDNGYSTLQPPIAVATLIIEQQPLLVGGVSTVRYFCQVDGRQSYDPDGEILLYAWSAPGGTPTSATTPEALFILTTLVGQTITLTVTDNQGQVGSIVLALDDPEVPVLRRQLVVAEGSAGMAFLNDGENWQSFTRSGRSCTAVPTFNELGALYSGWDDGAIYRINDAYDDIELVQTLTGGSIGVVYTNDGDGLQVLAGAGSKLWRAQDGATFSEVYDFADDINDAQSAGTNPNEMRVAVGNTLKISFDGGANWEDAIEGVAGSVCEMIATCPWGNAAVFSEGSAVGMTPGDALQFEGSASVDWSGVTSPPASLTMISPFWSEDGYLVGGPDGRQFKLVGEDGDWTASLIDTAGSGNETADGIRDGAIESLAFLALNGGTDPGTYKIVNKSTLHHVRSTPAYSIGYGQLGRYASVGGTLLIPTWGAATPGIHRREGTTWDFITFPVAGTFYFYGIAANRIGTELLLIATTDPTPRIYAADNEWFYHDIDASDRFVMRGSTRSPLWHYNIVTNTWTEIFLTSDYPGPFTFTGGSGPSNLHMPTWSIDRDREWTLTGSADSNFTSDVNFWYRGTGTTVGASATESGQTTSYMPASYTGLDGDIVCHAFFGASQLRYIPFGATAATIVGGNLANAPSGKGRIDPLRPTVDRAMVFAADNNDIYRSSDYRSVQATLALANIGSRITAANHGVYVGGRHLGGLYKITGILGTPVGSVATATGITTGWVRADRQTRNIVAVRLVGGTSTVITRDGVSWQTVSGPPGVPESELSTVLEVLGS